MAFSQPLEVEMEKELHEEAEYFALIFIWRLYLNHVSGGHYMILSSQSAGGGSVSNSGASFEDSAGSSTDVGSAAGATLYMAAIPLYNLHVKSRCCSAIFVRI